MAITSRCSMKRSIATVWALACVPWDECRKPKARACSKRATSTWRRTARTWSTAGSSALRPSSSNTWRWAVASSQAIWSRWGTSYRPPCEWPICGVASCRFGTNARYCVRPALGVNSRRVIADSYSWSRHVEKLWCFARNLRKERPATLATGDEYKTQVQSQWNNTPVGSERARRSQPHSIEWFKEIEADRYGADGPWMPEVMEFASHAGEDVLEIGGGLGIDLAQFAEHGARVTDVDLSAGHLALAEEHFQLRGLAGRFVHHDGEELPFADGSFDLVYSNGVIHHTPNTVKVVAEMYRVLRPGGRVIAMVYAENSLHYWRSLMWIRGMREGQLGTASIGEMMSRSVELSGTDARPLVKVYTRTRLRRLFHRFANIRIVQRQLQPQETPRPLRPFRTSIERMAGWNLVSKATKPQ